MDGSGGRKAPVVFFIHTMSLGKDKNYNTIIRGYSMHKPLAFLITTAAFGDIIGDPTDYMSYEVWSQSEEGFYAATVSSAVYTEPEQQDIVGLPEGAMLVTISVENDAESMLAIEDLDIYVGESTSEIAALVMPGYFFDNPDKDRIFDPFYNAPDYVDFAYETGLFSWDWGFSDDTTTDSLAPGESATVWIVAWAEDYTTSPAVLQGDGGVAVFESFVPDFDSIIIPAPGALAIGGMGVLMGGRRRRA